MTMIDNKSTDQNASSAGGQSQNLRLTGNEFRAGGFSISPPTPSPTNFVTLPDQFSLIQDGPSDHEIRVFWGLSAIRHPQTTCI